MSKTNAALVTTGMEPRRIPIPAGAHISVTFRCDAVGRYRDAVVFPSLGRLVTLPPHGEVVVDFPPLGAGEYDVCFSDGTPCGTLVATEPGPGDG